MHQDFGLDIFMHDSSSINQLFDYKNDTLNFSSYNRDIVENNSSDYYEIQLGMGSQYKNIIIRIRKQDTTESNYDFTLLDEQNNKRYKIMLNELIDLSDSFSGARITEKQLDKLSDSEIKEGTFYSILNSDLIKDTLTFDNTLNLYIKKALIKIK